MAQSEMSATDTLGHWVLCGLSGTDPVPDSGDSGLASAHAQGCWRAIITSVGNCPPHVQYVRGDNTTPIGNDSIA